MGQPDARRLQYNAILPLSSATNDDFQTLAQTYYLQVGDTIEFWDRVNGCLETLIGTRVITGICPDESITLDSAIDLTVVTGDAYIRNRTLDDVQVALDRLYEKGFEAEDMKVMFHSTITASQLDTPIVGQSIQTVPQSSLWEAGDGWMLISDAGLYGSGLVIATDDGANTVTIDDSVDATALTNPCFINTSLDLKTELLRLHTALDAVGSKTCEMLADGDCNNTAWYAAQNFGVGTSELFLDGVRKRKGTAGTRATLTNGAGNAQLLLTSVVLGLDGNDIDFQMIDPGAANIALSIAVTGTYELANRKVAVTLATDAGSLITSTALDVAAAINAHADAKRLLQAIYGGTGLGLQAALAVTALSGGLNDGTGDYAEIERVFLNSLTGGGYRIVSLHIRPADGNRLNSPPTESEELDLCYATSV